ncbi:sugar kinase [Mucilaginibacter terrae]|uniref:2-dehydro-3-deoxygluconokinase n=1 Tax=Mucilaginibacter terrae TaxID=1955052 RepID=A0ABU3GV63_9SPHI|nr:sugar kinase [Mucilaginibacter terrae]MDT3403667.1 2-dehydro-3-deoxygluconokinase [Mucilaginibacter terrae]
MSEISNKDYSSGSVLNFGELLLRLTPDADGDWLQENSLPVFVGGAELNVATALSLWDVPSRYFTALPKNGMSTQLISFLDEKNIDTSSIFYHGKRVGLYFLTKGQDLKHDALIYDRANSAFAELTTGLVDWDKVLDGVTWFHFSAICPAISQQAADVCREALEAASRKGITISVDLNYRAKLWQYGKQPIDVMPELAQYCDLIMGNIWAAERMLGVKVDELVTESGQKSLYVKEAQKSSEEIIKQFPKCKAVANTFRFTTEDNTNIEYYTVLYADGKPHVSGEYFAETIIDKVGSGDCYMAGLIYGYYNNYEPQETVDFATAAAFTKLFVNSDATNRSVDFIQQAIIK